jgi:hypothetical protein
MTSIPSLPAEIRNLIYSYSLVMGAVYPYQYLERDGTAVPYKSFPKAPVAAPSINLLGTCRAIRDEASPILYSQNDFHLPAGKWFEKFFTYALHNIIRRSWMKSVTMKLTSHDLKKHDYINLYKEFGSEEPGKMIGPKTELLCLEHVKWDEPMYYIVEELHKSMTEPPKTWLVLQTLGLDNLQLEINGPWPEEKNGRIVHYIRVERVKKSASRWVGFETFPPPEKRVDLLHWFSYEYLLIQVNRWRG